jgi:hypothetical protein
MTLSILPWFRFSFWKWPLLATLCAAGMWTYVNRVLVPHQISDAAAHQKPRGNLSDLYPHWLGAQELLLYGRDPYSLEVTRQIQQGYYGRSLDQARPGDPRDQQGFAYPVYVVFYLAPTIHFQFEAVRKVFFWILLGLTVAGILLWLRALRWSLPLWAQVSVIGFTVGTLTVVMGLKLQQLTLLVFAMLAASVALIASDWPIAAGIVLALSTIKPQLVWLVLLWLTIWTLADWRRRYRLLASFLLTMAVLCAASEWYLPHWIPRFAQQMRLYLNYTDAVSILDQMVPIPCGGLLRVVAVVVTVLIGWKNRRFGYDAPAFAPMASLALAVTIIVIPSHALYNQIFLLPAVLVLVRNRERMWKRSRVNRLLLSVTALLLVWSWLSSAALAILSFVLPPETVERAWVLPAWTIPQLSVAVAALMLVNYYQTTFDTPAIRSSS